MAATAAAVASILGTLVAGGSAISNSMANRGNPQGQAQLAIAARQLQDSENNDTYQRMLSALINQRSTAGSTDAYGSTVRYDPTTNQWLSTLGPQPAAVQNAADAAAISRNTTDLRQAQAANAGAMTRAAEAGPLADTSRRNLEDFRPLPQQALVGLLQQRATDAARATFDPLVADTLRQSQRTGTAAGPVLAELGRTQFNSLRDSLADAQIKGMTGINDINTANRTGLEQNALTTKSLATPQFQYPSIVPSGNSDTLANVVAARAQQGGIGAAYSASAVNTGAGQLQNALKNLQGSVPAPSNSLSTAGKEIGSMLQNKETTSGISTLYNKFFGGGSSGGAYDATKGDAFLRTLQPYMTDSQPQLTTTWNPQTSDTWGM